MLETETMKGKQEIVSDWLPRYTGMPLNQFGKYILLTNFTNYLELFAAWHNVPVQGKDKPMPKWMKEGIPAVSKGIDLGYETK